VSLTKFNNKFNYIKIQKDERTSERIITLRATGTKCERRQTEVLMWRAVDVVNSASANSNTTTIKHIEKWDPLHHLHVNGPHFRLGPHKFTIGFWPFVSKRQRQGQDNPSIKFNLDRKKVKATIFKRVLDV
jgi:hypothetical protein